MYNTSTFFDQKTKTGKQKECLTMSIIIVKEEGKGEIMLESIL